MCRRLRSGGIVPGRCAAGICAGCIARIRLFARPGWFTGNGGARCGGCDLVRACGQFIEGCNGIRADQRFKGLVQIIGKLCELRQQRLELRRQLIEFRQIGSLFQRLGECFANVLEKLQRCGKRNGGRLSRGRRICTGRCGRRRACGSSRAFGTGFDAKGSEQGCERVFAGFTA